MDLAIGMFKSPDSTASVSILLGQGDGTFQACGKLPAGIYTGSGVAEVNFITADVNGDGKPDLLARAYAK